MRNLLYTIVKFFEQLLCEHEQKIEWDVPGKVLCVICGKVFKK